MDYDDFIVDGDAAPVFCKTIQPWKDPEGKWKDPNADHSEMHERILNDLLGCILSQWKKYQQKFNAAYSQAEAISDAYHLGILKAIERDAKAPVITKSVDCSCCGNKYDPHKDADGNPVEQPGDARAHKIFAEFPADRVPTKRRIATWCSHCGAKNITTIYKTQFSTCVFPYIRAAIQKGVQKHSTKKGVVSIDGFSSDSENSLLDVLESKNSEENDVLPVEVLEILYEVMEALPERQRNVLAMAHGIGGVFNEVVTRQICCPECHKEARTKEHEAKKSKSMEELEISRQMLVDANFEIDIDYGLSRNDAKCPTCGYEFNVDMSMNQTDIARHLNVSKQRVCSTIKGIMARLRGDINERNVDYHIWKKLTDRLSAAVNNYEVI